MPRQVPTPVPAPEARQLLEELGNALQSALLLASGLERALCDTHWTREATLLRQAVERAARATVRLGELARAQRARRGLPTRR